MNPLNFTLAQIEAFACVCETGTLTHAAKKLRKDRTTVSELVEYLEMDLGYALFDRSSRPLKLTEAGERLWRQAQLFLHEAQMFSQVARQIPEHLSARLTLCYDPFTPRDFLLRLQGALAMRQIRVDLLLGERGDAQRWLAEGSVDVGIFQALNRSINESLQWRSVGSISLAVYARRGFFDEGTVSLLNLASRTQLMPFRELPEWLKLRLQIADDVQRINDAEMLRELLCAGAGWAFLPVHMRPERWPDIVRVETEVGDNGLAHPLVALWRPGQIAQPVLTQFLEAIRDTWTMTS
ncbi:LysR family transcriptional regulator [Erwinia sp. HR93]|uniref:LysR family transcriptional regulator n=1 Tax=Erwinia sp. HR93 TaxID=3094840 RepID=UPI002ADEE8C0|nr:LysR family transcriptional regulator [Erwinia sp. HR93]MEA1064382.1 LysR family transcriptional regulator [Erwinia sp. HR93]